MLYTLHQVQRHEGHAGTGFTSGIIRQTCSGAEKISMAPVQGSHAQIEKLTCVCIYIYIHMICLLLLAYIYIYVII